MTKVESRETVTIGVVRIADDGVVFIPREREVEVPAVARRRASKESTVLAELLKRKSLRAVWDRHRIL